MRVLFRTDSSVQIGSGHLMRSLTLAKMLAREGADVSFVCRDLPGNMSALVKGHNFKLILLSHDEKKMKTHGDKYGCWLGVDWEEDAEQTALCLKKTSTSDWLIIDHYALDDKWERAMRPCVGNIMVIDDLANRSHDCDLLLDQNLYDHMETRYDELVSRSCRKLLGPEFVLLRDEFIKQRANKNHRIGTLSRIFVFFGGSDITEETLKTLQVVIQSEFDSITFDFVVGVLNSRKDDIQSICQNHDNINFHCQINNIAELMSQADLAIGGGGATTYERYCLGIPSVVIAVADNQIEAAETSHNLGLSYYLGEYNVVDKEQIHDALVHLRNNPEALIEYERNTLNIVDGQGANKVTQVLARKGM